MIGGKNALKSNFLSQQSEFEREKSGREKNEYRSARRTTLKPHDSIVHILKKYSA